MSDAKLVGAETIQGRAVRVYQFVVHFAKTELPAKAWISNADGLLYKQQAELKDPSMTSMNGTTNATIAYNVAVAIPDQPPCVIPPPMRPR